MTNQETCGHPTSDGTPCQNPASDGNSCWLNEHGGNAAPSGRDFSLSEEDHDDILDAAREGLSKSGCARAAGVSHTELNRYLESHDEFRAAFAQARAQGEQVLVERGLYDPDADSSMAKFLLSTSFEYVKTEKRELEDVTDGDGGFGTTVVLDSEYATDDE